MYLEHVNLTVSDLDRSIRFYSDAFGYRVRWRGTTTGGTPAAHVGDDRCYVALFQATKKPAAKVDADYVSVGFNHFGIVVENLDQMRQRLTTLGAEPTEDQDYEPGRRFYCTDPDGFEIELVQYDAVSTERTSKVAAAAR